MNLENFPDNNMALEMMDMVSTGWYKDSYVGKWLFQVMGIQMEDAYTLFEELREQIFPETATWGLVYHEQKYGLTTSYNLSIEKRRDQILKQRNYKLPMNPERVRQLIENITGKRAEIKEHINPYTFLIKVIINSSDSEINEELLRKQVDKIKPSHLAYQIMTERPLTVNIYVGAMIQQAEIINLRQVI